MRLRVHVSKLKGLIRFIHIGFLNTSDIIIYRFLNAMILIGGNVLSGKTQKRLNLSSKFIWYAIGAVLFIVVFFPFITGELLYIYRGYGADSLWSYWPLRHASLEWLRGESTGGWMWNLGLGTNVFSIQGYLLDPFNVLLIFYSAENLPVGMLIVAIVKLCLAGLMFYQCLRWRNMGVNASRLASLIFTFNGYAVLWSCLDVNATAYLLTVGILYGYERYRGTHKPAALVVFTGLLAAISPYYLWMAAIFMGVYIVIDCISHLTFNIAWKYIMRVVAWAASGVGLFAFVFWPGVRILMSNPRIDGSILPSLKPATLYESAVTILRGMNVNILGDLNYIPVSYFSGPLWTTSLLALVSLPQLLKKPLNTLSIKITTFVILFSMVFINITIPVFNGFSQGTYRWNWFLIIPVLLGAAKVWTHYENGGKTSKKLTWISWGTVCFLWLICLTYVVKVNNIDLHDATSRHMIDVNIALASLLIGLGILIWLKSYCSKRIISKLMIFFVVVELGLFSSQITYNRIPLQPQERQTTYFDGTQQAVELIKEIEGQGFYRIDKDYQSVFLDDAPIQNFNGTKSYLSSNNPNYFKFSEVMGAEPNYNFIFGFDGRPQMQTLLGVKYLFSRTQTEYSGFELVDKVGDINILRNKNPLPLGFVYNERVEEEEFVKLAKEEKEAVLLQAAVVSEGVANNFPDSGPANINLSHSDNDIQRLASRPFRTTDWNNNGIRGNVDADEGGLLYLSIPFDSGWSALVDGNPTVVEYINMGFIGLELGPGEHTIEMKYTPPGLKTGLILSTLTVMILIIRKIHLMYLKRKRNSPLKDV